MGSEIDLGVSLHSESKLTLLNDIDELRSLGISDIVALPQLIVCGDQSSGKSSVLEAISGIPFPTKDNLCTRFATEVILRQHGQQSVEVSISPSRDRPETERKTLSQFHFHLTNYSDFAKLVQDAHIAMTAAGSSTQTFYKDVLRLKVSGPTQPHLTIVDLPGLFHAETKEQSEEDVKTVRRMVREYMKSPRSIILAVISAKNDLAMQVVRKLMRNIDPRGTRTLGIITKPDELRVGSESQSAILRLARNEDFVLDLGWHVLRNRDYNERDSTTAQRDETESRFFETGEWKRFPRNLVGIASLKPKLSDILFEQIKFQLPSVVADLEEATAACEGILEQLGDSRDTIDEQRAFLLRLSDAFRRIVYSAMNGLYEDSFFGRSEDEGAPTKRLRALIQNESSAFADAMRVEGHERDVIEDRNLQDEGSPRSTRPCVTRSDFVDEIKDLLMTERGRELPGTFNPLLVGKIFLRHSQPWEGLVKEYLDDVWNATNVFLSSVADEVFPSSVASSLRELVITPGMNARKKGLMTKMKELLWPYRHCHPITYNHYFTESIQKVKRDRLEIEVNALLRENLNVDSRVNNATIIRDVTKLLSSRSEADMDRYACNEILDCMEAFYKVALKMIVDNTAIYAVEMCLMRDLERLLDPIVIGKMDDETVRSVATESAGDRQRREEQQQKLRILRKGLQTCQAHATSRIEKGEDPVERRDSSEDSSRSVDSVDEALDRRLESEEEVGRERTVKSQDSSSRSEVMRETVFASGTSNGNPEGFNWPAVQEDELPRKDKTVKGKKKKKAIFDWE